MTAAVLAATLLSSPAAAAPYLVKDIDPSPGTLHSCGGIREIVPAGSTLFMSVDDCQHGEELWASDGTTEGTRLVRDIATGELSSLPGAMTSLNGRLVFFADDGVHGRALWASDGTEAGTQLVKQLAPDVVDGGELPLVGGIGIFATRDGSNGVRLWRTDGTPDGTAPFMNFPGSPTAPVWVTLNAYNTIVTTRGLLFSLSSGPAGTNGGQLWLTDGTQAGTRMLRDGFDGIGACVPSRFRQVGTLVFFAAGDRGHGCEPWVTDLTPGGTHELANLNRTGPYGGNSFPQSFTELNGRVLFFATGDGHGQEPWITNGTAEGTTLLADLEPGPGGSTPNLLFANGEVAYIHAQDPRGGPFVLWRTDGSPAGTERLPTGFSRLRYGYRADQPVSAVYLPEVGRIGLIESDGTPVGKPYFYTFDYGAEPRRFTRVGETIFFTMLDPQTRDLDAELWRTDGTAEGTRRVATLAVLTSSSADSSPRNFVAFGGRVLFAAHTQAEGTELWISDGTPDGTHLVRDIWPGPDDSNPAHLVDAGDVAYFAARDRDHGLELWRTDGTAAGTALVGDLRSGPDSSDPYALFVSRGRVFFVADDGAHGDEPWMSDGAGTTLLEDLRPGPVGSMQRSDREFPTDDSTAYQVGLSGPFHPFGQGIAFVANDGPHGRELWVSDGTSRGTRLVKDINPGGSDGVDPRELVVLGDESPRIYFAADDGNRGQELWVSDGTARGTRLAVELTPGSRRSGITSLVSALGHLFFFAFDDDGLHIMRSDGTPAGTILLAAPYGPRRMRPAGSNVFFDVKYEGLYRIDAPSGDVSHIDLGPTVSDDGGDPTFLATVGNTLVGVVRNQGSVCPADPPGAICRMVPDTGYEPFVTDGSPAGTHTLGNIAIGRESSSPGAAVAVGSLLFFDAWTPEYGRELWAERLATECGNGVLDAGEACDDGPGNGANACCSAGCQVVDSDDDGRCDRDDPCIAGAPTRTLLRARNGRWSITSRLRNVLGDEPGRPPHFNPSATGMRIVIQNRTATVLDVVVPPGAARKGRRSGWRTIRRGLEWVYATDRAHATSNIRRVVVRRHEFSSRSVTVSVWGTNDVHQVTAGGLPLEVTLILDSKTFPSRRCGITSFREARCVIDRTTGTIRCR